MTITSVPKCLVHGRAAGGDADVAPEHGPRRCRAEGDDHPWAHRRHLGLQPRVARFDLRRARLLVDPPLAADLVLEVLHGVGGIEVAAFDPGFLDAAPQHCSRRSHERQAAPVLDVARLLADEHELAFGAPLPKTVCVASR